MHDALLDDAVGVDVLVVELLFLNQVALYLVDQLGLVGHPVGADVVQFLIQFLLFLQFLGRLLYLVLLDVDQFLVVGQQLVQVPHIHFVLLGVLLADFDDLSHPQFELVTVFVVETDFGQNLLAAVYLVLDDLLLVLVPGATEFVGLDHQVGQFLLSLDIAVLETVELLHEVGVLVLETLDLGLTMRVDLLFQPGQDQLVPLLLRLVVQFGEVSSEGRQSLSEDLTLREDANGRVMVGNLDILEFAELALLLEVVVGDEGVVIESEE